MQIPLRSCHSFQQQRPMWQSRILRCERQQTLYRLQNLRGNWSSKHTNFVTINCSFRIKQQGGGATLPFSSMYRNDNWITLQLEMWNSTWRLTITFAIHLVRNLCKKVQKVVTLQHVTKDQRCVEVKLYSFSPLGEGWVVNATPWPLYPRRGTWYALYRRLSGPQGRYRRMRKISPPMGFDPWTVQTIASRYTDWATPANTCVLNYKHGDATRWKSAVVLRLW